MYKRHLYLATTASAIGLAMSAPAIADETPQPSAAQASGQVEEVIVTANRRSENAQTVPISVAAISGDSAIAGGVTDPQSLANAVPGLAFERQTGNSLSFLRGVGSPVGQNGIEPSVAYYVDDVYEPFSGATMANFNSIDRLEVEYGPQGTLFGRNATGGVIQVFTKNPTPDAALDTSVGYANYDTVSGSFYATGAIAPDLSANIALYGSNQGDGWGRNITTGQPAFKVNWDFGGRIKFLWEPDSRTTALLALDHDYTESQEGYFQPRQGTLGAGFFSPAPGFYDTVDHTNPAWSNVQSGVSLKLTHDFGWANLVDISAYRWTVDHQTFDEAGSPVYILPLNVFGPDETWTQEIRLLSPDGAPLTWIVGAFYMFDKAGYAPITFYQDNCTFDPAAGCVFPPYAKSFAMQATNSYSGFGQATATILPDTHLTAGLRYTVDERVMTAWLFNEAAGPPVFAPAANSPQSLTSGKLSGRVSLDHQFTDDIMGYISYNRGFKSATFNTIVIPLPAAFMPTIAPPVRPETLDDYSIGEKAEFFDHRLRLNTEAFYYTYRNIQINEILAGVSYLSNAAAATIKGVDVSATIVPVDGLTLTAAAEVLDGHYTSYPNGLLWVYNPGPCASNCTKTANLAGNKTIYTPPFSLNLTADYIYPTSLGNFDFTVAYNHGGDYFFDPDNGRGQINPSFDKQPPLNIVNASVLWTPGNGMYDVRLWGKNITGVKYISFGDEDAFNTQYSPAPPATYGITLSAHL